MRLVAVAGSICAAAVCNEDEVVFNQIDRLFLAVLNIYDLLGNFFVAFGFYNDVFHVHAVFNAYSVRFKVFDEREYHALILIVFCKAEGAEIGESVDMMHIADITLHFKCA